MTPTSTKNDSLYVNGCSFAYGIGIDVRESLIKENRFSKILADKLNLIEINNSIPGSCNARILRRALIDIPRIRPKLAVIIWSDPARFEVMHNNAVRHRNLEDADQVRPLSVYSYPNPTKQAFLDYYSYVSSNHRDVMYTMQYMLTIKILCDALKIPCIQLPFKSSFNRELLKIISNTKNTSLSETIHDYIEELSKDSLIFGITQNISFDSISGCDINPEMLSKLKGQEGHPNAESHKILSEWISALIDLENLL